MTQLLTVVTPILLTVVGFFLLRLIVQLDRNTVACTELTAKITGVTSSISVLERDVQEVKAAARALRREVNYQAERSHSIVNRVTTLGVVMAQNGMIENAEWDIPQRPGEPS